MWYTLKKDNKFKTLTGKIVEDKSFLTYGEVFYTTYSLSQIKVLDGWIPTELKVSFKMHLDFQVI